MAQALTFRNEFLREHAAVLGVSVLLHLTLLVLLALNLNFLPRTPPPPARLAIQATVVVDDRVARARAAEAERRQRQMEQAEQQRQEREQREAARREAEAQRAVEEQQRAERQRQAQAEERQRAEARRKADAEARAQADARARAEAKAQAEAQAKARAESEAKAQADAKAKAEADAKAKAEAKARAEADRRRAQTQADLARQLAEEEALAAVAGSPAAAEYRAIIAQKVRRNWNEPASARPGDSCEVRVQQIPGGEVTSAVALNCTGDAAFARSVETAVLKASPLPLPSDPRLFERNLLFTFKPEK